MLRLSDPRETETNLALSGKVRQTGLIQRGLDVLGYNDRRCLLVYGLTGDAQTTRETQHQVHRLASQAGGLFSGTASSASLGATIGKIWRKSRFLTPYLRNTLWEKGVAVDTLESALPWSQVIPAVDDCMESLQQALSTFNEEVLSFAHLSHVYPDGASFYITYIFRLALDPEESLVRWQAMKSAASQRILARGGTISHQHGVGLDHVAYLPAEKGMVGIRLLETTFRELDPQGLLNPGKLIARSQVPKES